MIKAFRNAFAEWWWGPVYLVEVQVHWTHDPRPLRITFRTIRATSRAAAVAEALRSLVARGHAEAEWGDFSEVRVVARRA
jgi:hypothetical protein